MSEFIKISSKLEVVEQKTGLYNDGQKDEAARLFQEFKSITEYLFKLLDRLDKEVN